MQTSLNFLQFSTSVFWTQVEPNLTKLRTITKQEAVFQLLVLISARLNLNHFEFAAAILEKGLFRTN